MRMLLVSCVFLLALAAARAEEMPNTLTPEQAAGGWKLLFDGANSEGLRTQGDVTVKDGTLIIGGNARSRVEPRDPLPAAFHWQMQYRVTGSGQVSLDVQSGPPPTGHSFGGWAQTGGNPEAWHALRVTGEVDRRKGVWKVSFDQDDAGVGVTHDLNPGSDILAVALDVQPGTQLHLRNVLLQVDPPSQSGLYWLYGLVGGLVAAVVALALFAYRRSTRRRALED